MSATVSNGSFESGLNGWTFVDLTIPFQPLGVQSAGFINNFGNVVIPSDGSSAVSHGFDGNGPGAISLSQDIGTVLAGETLSFDYRAGWDIFGGTLDRTFLVQIEPGGGGAPLASYNIFTAVSGTNSYNGSNSDTGSLTATIDLSSFAGSAIRTSFLWNIPESFTGPGNFQLDNVKIAAGSTAVPEPFTIIGTLVGGTAALRMRKKLKSANKGS